MTIGSMFIQYTCIQVPQTWLAMYETTCSMSLACSMLAMLAFAVGRQATYLCLENRLHWKVLILPSFQDVLNSLEFHRIFTAFGNSCFSFVTTFINYIISNTNWKYKRTPIPFVEQHCSYTGISSKPLDQLVISKHLALLGFEVT